MTRKADVAKTRGSGERPPSGVAPVGILMPTGAAKPQEAAGGAAQLIDDLPTASCRCATAVGEGRPTGATQDVFARNVSARELRQLDEHVVVLNDDVEARLLERGAEAVLAGGHVELPAVPWAGDS